MYVFAISLPYTNPHKYDHYTVSLAHHVIAGWFLKCKLSLRKDFVNYIQKGFTTNVKKVFEEQSMKIHQTAVNEDSSNRKRSSSLTERGAKQRVPSLKQIPFKSEETADEIAYNFHMELADTCIDFLSRHTYSTISALPKRSPTAEYLLGNGQSMSWLVGHNIITITTSSCSSTAVKNGLCDRCALVCRPQSLKASLDPNSSSNGATSPEINSIKSSSSELCKRYTKATLQHHSGQESESSEISSNSSSMTVNSPFVQSEQTIKFSKQTSNEGRFSNSSGSLDALSRRGSNPDTLDHSTETVSKHSSASNPMYLSPQQSIERIKQICICSCSGYAEVVVRRPTGNMSWIMRIQNHITLDSLTCDVPLQDLIHMCTPSLGEIYNFQDLLNEEQAWNNLNSTTEQAATNLDLNKRKETADVKLQPEKIERKVEATASAIQKEENIADMTSIFTDVTSNAAAETRSGPINIPKSNHQEKIPSGSFSDVEIEDDDVNSNNVTFDENESRLRNPVRRVNSSPEMRSNWRHPYMSQKSNQSTQNADTTMPTGNDDDFNAIDTEQQLKKKNYGKVSCEAIPEEIADSTPPNPNQVIRQMPKDDNNTISVVATGLAKNQQNDFISKSNSANASVSKDTLTPFNQSSALPRKQHSADDALQQQEQLQSKQQQQINEPRHSSSGSAINLGSMSTGNKQKLSIDMPNLTTKPPQSHAPLSPRLLARNNPESANSNFNDFPRGRSKTISVVRGEHDRDNNKWTFKGSKLK